MSTINSKIKVMTILGTRPEIIRLSRVMAMLDQYTDHCIVHTGQNYDYELNGIFFNDLGVRKPDFFLEVNTSSLGNFLGDTLKKTEEVIDRVKPDAVLILGDTNSSIAGIIAKRKKIPIYHMEAGNRCFDLNVPEEINRRIIDHIADFNLVYTEHARRHLIAEGIPQRRIYLTGSPMYEVLKHYSDGIQKSEILKKLDLQDGKYFVVSTHREENVDNKENLKIILRTLNGLAEQHGLPVIVSTHPRTRKRLADLEGLKLSGKVQFLDPFGFFDYVHLQQKACCTLSDSGTISEESAILNFPAVTVRNAIERPEALDAGTIVLTGLDETTILRSVDMVVSDLSSRKYPGIPDEYQVEDTSMRVVRLIMGTSKLSNQWHGIVKNG
ncbi:MAG: UDP-N-acetylglucosamine 2-epimerase (non-hydrolyzing) [Bacteroidales bacterium]